MSEGVSTLSARDERLTGTKAYREALARPEQLRPWALPLASACLRYTVYTYLYDCVSFAFHVTWDEGGPACIGASFLRTRHDLSPQTQYVYASQPARGGG